MLYERAKHDGTLPIVGVNTFISEANAVTDVNIELARATDEEKQGQIRRLSEFCRRHSGERDEALARLRESALSERISLQS